MKLETVTQGHVKLFLKDWASNQVAEMRELGIVCVDCDHGLLLLGYKDRIHCKRRRRSIRARKQCKGRET